MIIFDLSCCRSIQTHNVSYKGQVSREQDIPVPNIINISLAELLIVGILTKIWKAKLLTYDVVFHLKWVFLPKNYCVV